MTAIEIAKHFVGMRETNGKNRAPWIDALCRFVGIPLGSPYCAAGESYCLHKSREDSSSTWPELFKTGSSQAVKKWAKENGRLFWDPTRLLDCKAAVGGWTNEGDSAHGHTFLIAKRYTNLLGLGKKVTHIGTIEFNTGPDGGRDGDGCYDKKRSVPVSNGHELWFVDLTGYVPGWWS